MSLTSRKIYEYTTEAKKIGCNSKRCLCRWCKAIFVLTSDVYFTNDKIEDTPSNPNCDCTIYDARSTTCESLKYIENVHINGYTIEQTDLKIIKRVFASGLWKIDPRFYESSIYICTVYDAKEYMSWQ